MKILFVMRAAATFSHHKSIIEALAKRGHTVTALFDKAISKKSASEEELSELKKDLDDFDYDYVPSRQDFWRNILLITRELATYRNYLLMGEQSDFYRRDWIKFLPRRLRPFLFEKNSLANFLIKRRILGFILFLIEKFVPPDTKIVSMLKQYKPDAVLATPINFRHSSADLEYLKAAKIIGIPTALPVYSWDNLTVRGLVHIIPDLVLCWNEVQAEEAVKHHNIPKDIIRLTGAFLFDRWFTHLSPSTDRQTFCSNHGISPNHPYLLYLGSSHNIASNEVWLARNLRSALDKSGDRGLSDVQLVIRPHPAHFRIYEELEGEEKIFILPRQGRLPSTKNSFQLFYDTLHYSIGTIGINTSGMIDALIADKSGSTVLVGKYAETQEQALHFRQMLEAGAIRVLSNLDEFPDSVKGLLRGDDPCRENRRAFIKKFIRPCGIDKSAGELAVKAIERLVLRV